jgi:hypothetical protein
MYWIIINTTIEYQSQKIGLHYLLQNLNFIYLIKYEKINYLN